MRDGRPTSPRFAIGFSPVFGESAASIPNGKVTPLPTAQKDRIYYGKQAQFNVYKQSLQNLQGERQMAGSPVLTEAGAGPYNIQVQTFDGFGPMYDDLWDQ